ncbi:hypothetical protein Q4488_18485 [Amphritea sp. 1_MG-2023]|uniref:hypothetical protein n=1 Tax=Amphritea sp. 1_MG-2023 TaxID=3062670 RepID=UPI0026E38A41|nr:hypothetical protein [Amphritea sp. 1_MG-2023]MDO6565363.1 hypothetical protein [Amphritea sp. 1_MG-2023]
MEQSLRHQYLQTMGIVSWLPRRPLPGAQSTPDWVWEYCWPEAEGTAPSANGLKAAPIFNPADRAMAAKQARAELSASFDAGSDRQSASGEANAPTEADKPKQAAAKLNQSTIANDPSVASLSSAGITSDVQASCAPQDQAQVQAQAQTSAMIEPSEPTTATSSELSTPSKLRPQPPFKLAFMLYQDCLVIDSLPPVSASARSLHNSGQADAHHQILLDKILRSIGLTGGSTADYYALQWPMFASKSLDQGAQQARLTVQHKLRKSLQKAPVGTVLLLGEAAAQMVLERDESLDQLRGVLFSLRSQVKTLASASLTEMMMLPGCKRDVWGDLQPLLNHLQDSAISDE